LVMLQFSDKFHRAWNDLKLSFKDCGELIH
jgi:hypothetical protein